MSQSPAASPPLPPEILTLIFDKIEDQSDLLRCSIVCRGWLPYARNNLRLWVSASDPTDRSASTWTEIIANPENTFTSTLHHLHLYEARFTGRVWTPLIPLLGAFTCLRTLELVDADITDLPALPSLNHLALCRIRFQSYPIFVAVMSKLSHIQSLKLDVVSWRVGINDDQLEDLFPALQLVSLELGYFDERFMFALRPRRLVLAFVTEDFISATLPKYLVSLGPHLQTLALIFCPTIEQAATLDFRHNTNLARLNIRFAIDFDHEDCGKSIAIHRSLVPLLSRIARHARLQSLTLHVQARSGPLNHDWTPFSGLVQLLGTDAFSSVHTIEFLVHPHLYYPSGLDLRSCFESTLSAAISDNRVVYTIADD